MPINTSHKPLNSNLNKAKKEKNDEYYTYLDDIAKEVIKYKDQLKGKVILMPCDDPELIKIFPNMTAPEEKASQFWVYFHKQFSFLGLKKIIATHYSGSDNDAYKIEYGGGSNDCNILDFKKTPLVGNGDFRSAEIQKLYDEADVIITNPPFSLLRDFIGNLIKKQKKFLIIGNKGAISYKEISQFIKNKELWLGYTAAKEFMSYDKNTKQITNKKFGNVGWFTNLDVSYRNEKLILCKQYNSVDYQKYDGWDDIIEVDKVKNIPCDYSGRMGVPITFLEKYNPNQFEILEIVGNYKFLNKKICYVNGKKKFSRIIIQKKNKN